MENNKWEVKSHSYPIADTGDYDGYYEITNGNITLTTRDDYEETERQLQIAAAVLNKWGINFFDQKVDDLLIDIHCMKDAQRWKDEEFAALQAKCDKYVNCIQNILDYIGECEGSKISLEGRITAIENTLLKALSGKGIVLTEQEIEAEITRRWNSTVYNPEGTRKRESYREGVVSDLINQKEDKQ